MLGFRLSPVARQLGIAIFVSFSNLQMGMQLAWTSPVLSKLTNVNQTVLLEPLSVNSVAWVTGASYLTCSAALLLNSYISNRFGRKTSIILATIPRFVACLLFIFASKAWMLILGRGFMGVSDNVVSLAATYNSEIASKEVRGAIGTMSPIMASLGVMLMLSFGPYVSYQTLQIIYTCIIVVTFVPILFVPESPYYWYSKGKKEKCIAVLTYLRGSESSVQEELKEYSLIKDVKLSKKDIFNDIIVLKTLGKVVILGIGSQMVGYYILLFNLQSLFEMTHSSISPELSSMTSGCIQLLACFCTLLTTDKYGRKPLLTMSLIGLSVGMIGMGTFFKLTEHMDNITGFLNYLPLISVMLVIFCHTIGMAAILFTVCTELFDGPLRSYAVSLLVSISCLLVFGVTMYFHVILEVLGPAPVYWTFSASAALLSVFIGVCLPETKGKPFSQIQRELGRDVDRLADAKDTKQEF